MFDSCLQHLPENNARPIFDANQDRNLTAIQVMRPQVGKAHTPVAPVAAASSKQPRFQDDDACYAAQNSSVQLVTSRVGLPVISKNIY